MKCIIYARVSTDKQDVKNQLDLCAGWCQQKYPSAQAEVYQDPDVSSRLPIEKRPALASMLEKIRKGDVVVVFKLDRIARDIVEMVTIYRMIEVKGAKVYSLSEPDVQGWMLGIFGALAQKEREDISMRIKAGLKARRERHERTGHVPYGFKVKGGIFRTPKNRGTPLELVHEPSEMRVLREMERLRALGESWRRVAEILNELGYRTRTGVYSNRGGGPWTHHGALKIYRAWEQNQERMRKKSSLAPTDDSNRS